jgi:hypothetical protein
MCTIVRYDKEKRTAKASRASLCWRDQNFENGAVVETTDSQIQTVKWLS